MADNHVFFDRPDLRLLSNFKPLGAQRAKVWFPTRVAGPSAAISQSASRTKQIIRGALSLS